MAFAGSDASSKSSSMKSSNIGFDIQSVGGRGKEVGEERMSVVCERERAGVEQKRRRKEGEKKELRRKERKKKKKGKVRERNESNKKKGGTGQKENGREGKIKEVKGHTKRRGHNSHLRKKKGDRVKLFVTYFKTVCLFCRMNARRREYEKAWGREKGTKVCKNTTARLNESE